MNIIQYEHIHNDDSADWKQRKILEKLADALNNKAVGFPDLANTIIENTVTGLTFKQFA